MSAILEAKYIGENFLLEVTRDGDFKFLNYDIDYDLSMVEFGEPKSIAIGFVDKWKFNTIETILIYCDLTEYQKFMIAADMAEHVLPIFKSYNSEDKGPENAIKAARKYAQSIATHAEESARKEASIAATEAARVALSAIWDDNLQAAASQAARSARNAALGKVLDASKAAGWAIENSVKQSQQAMTWSVRDIQEVIDEETTKEYLWQLHRIIDCIEAVQSGKAWPPMEATT